MIQVSTESVLAALGALIGCITFLFKMLQSAQQREVATLRQSKDETIAEKDKTIAWLKEEIQLSLRTTERSVTAAEVALSAVKTKE